ncbi:MAG: hypothetical protein R2847_11895 [Bacteroidia bacterium]
MLWYSGKKLKVPAWVICDATAPGLMLSYGTGRLGCHLAGDGDWGIVNTAAKPSWFPFLTGCGVTIILIMSSTKVFLLMDLPAAIIVFS